MSYQNPSGIFLCDNPKKKNLILIIFYLSIEAAGSFRRQKLSNAVYL